MSTATQNSSSKQPKGNSSTPFESDDKSTRAERLKLFQQWESALTQQIAQEKEKTCKYPLYRVTDNGRWMYVVCSDNSEISFTKAQMNQYRSAEEWVSKGGKCPFDLKKVLSPHAD